MWNFNVQGVIDLPSRKINDFFTHLAPVTLNLLTISRFSGLFVKIMGCRVQYESNLDWPSRAVDLGLAVDPLPSCQFFAVLMWCTCACPKSDPSRHLARTARFQAETTTWRTTRKTYGPGWSRRNPPWMKEYNEFFDYPFIWTSKLSLLCPYSRFICNGDFPRRQHRRGPAVNGKYK